MTTLTPTGLTNLLLDSLNETWEPTKVDGERVDAVLEMQSDSEGVLFPRVTTAARLAMIVENGTQVFDKTIGKMFLYQSDAWINIDTGNGDVVGPAGATDGDIVTFDGITGKLIKDSGVNISAVPELDAYIAGRKLLDITYAPLVNVNEVADVGNLAYVDRGIVFVNNTFPIETYNFDVPSSAQTVLVTDGNSLTPATFGSVFEASSDTQAMTIPRLTQAAIDDLVTNTLTIPGQIMYNSTVGDFYGVKDGNPVPVPIGLTGIENDALNSIYVGKNAGNTTITGANNSSLGEGTLHLLTSGSGNTAAGVLAGASLTTGSSNVMIGSGAGQSLVTEDDAIFIGKDAGNVAIAGEMIAIGAEALTEYSGNQPSNIAIGAHAAVTLLDGAENIFIGYNSGEFLDHGTGNTCVGFRNLYVTDGVDPITRNFCTAIGASALGDSNCGNGSTAVGYHAAKNVIASSTGITALGFKSLEANTTGNRITSIGYNALLLCNASDQTAVGYNALSSNVSGVACTAVGSFALQDNTVAGNTAVGYSALKNNVTGTDCTAVGHNSLFNSTGNQNTAVGAQTLEALTTGTDSTAIGYNALSNVQANSYNTAVGSGTLQVAIGSGNTAVGAQAGGSVAGGVSNSLFGYYCAPQLSGGTGNCAMGFGAFSGQISGDYNVSIGYSSMEVLSNSTGIVAIGANALQLGDGGVALTAIGYNSLQLGGVTSFNTAVGYQAMQGAIAGSDSNTAVGYQSLFELTTASANNVAIGAQAGANLTNNSTDNVLIGFNAGINMFGACAQNVIIGSNSGGSTGVSDSIIVGFISGQGITSAAVRSIGIGNSVFNSLTTGIDNCSIGHSSSQNLNIGNLNTIFGNFAFQVAETYSCTAMGYSALSGASGPNNTCVGRDSLLICSGQSNAAFGTYAGDSNANVNYCTFLGSSTNATVNGLTNASAIGANALVSASNNITLGDSTIPTSVSIGVNKAATGEILHILGEMAIQGYSEATTAATGGYTRKGQYFTTTNNSTSSHQFPLDIIGLEFASQYVTIQLVAIAANGSAAAYAGSAAGVWWNDVTVSSTAPVLPLITVVNSSGVACSATWTISAAQLTLNVTSTNISRWIVNYEFIVAPVQR